MSKGFIKDPALLPPDLGATSQVRHRRRCLTWELHHKFYPADVRSVRFITDPTAPRSVLLHRAKHPPPPSLSPISPDPLLRCANLYRSVIFFSQLSYHLTMISVLCEHWLSSGGAQALDVAAWQIHFLRLLPLFGEENNIWRIEQQFGQPWFGCMDRTITCDRKKEGNNFISNAICLHGPISAKGLETCD